MKPIPAGFVTTTNTSSPQSSLIAGDRAFYATAALAFAGAAAATFALCRSMAGGMDMPGGWTMSMAWMKMPGQSWSAATSMFMQMWLVMMVAMMMPSLAPMLARYRRALRGRSSVHVPCSTLLAAVGYFVVWQAVGALAYPLGIAFAAGTMHWASLSRSVPPLTGAALVVGGLVQSSSWKMRKLVHCRDPNACRDERASADTAGAWSHGVELGLCCASCCAGFMLALLVLGTMDLAVMGIIALAISLERLLPRPTLVAKVSGAAMLAFGAIILGRLTIA